MAVSLEKLPQVVDVLVRMGAKKIVLFGSALEDPARAKDVDLAVDGIPPARILDADVAVMDTLQQPFDLVAKDLNPTFFSIVERYGKVLHG
jgi:predicted nucleotidyltransferase